MRTVALTLLLLVASLPVASAQPFPPVEEETPPVAAPAPGEEAEIPPPAPTRPRRVTRARVAPAAASADSPVVRAEPGNIGMRFRFGGLATLLHGSNPENVGGHAFGDIGLKFVLSEQLMLPIWFGTLLRVDAPDGVDASTSWGIDVGAGLEYHFRIWRRISPFIGGVFGVEVRDPTGESNAGVGIGFGPNMGIEYYIGDRVSVSAMYLFLITIGFQDGPASTTSLEMATNAGGALDITYYF